MAHNIKHEERAMRVSIFGLGYIGSVTAACLAESGHEVIGVDPNRTKVDLINSGLTPVIEKGLDEIIKTAVDGGRLSATPNGSEAIDSSDLSFICVGTPSLKNGSLDLQYVEKVCQEIGKALRGKSGFHLVVVRSTVLPGTIRRLIVPTLESNSGRRAGHDFGVCSNPEFLREGTAVSDYRNPPKTVIGADDGKTGDILAGLYESIDAPLIRTGIEVAELVKYADNAWHAIKVGFANEIGNVAKESGIDSHIVMDIFCQDTKLNLSPYYLKPGFAFGGSCLPKDLRALTYLARMLDLRTPILNSVLESNRLQIERGLDLITERGCRKIGVLGISFKAGTDDLRESPIVEVIETLIGKGYDLRLFDQNVKLASLVGANRDYIQGRIPHISRLMVDSIDEILDHAEVVVIGNKAPEFLDVLDRLHDGQQLVDLVRITDSESIEGRYSGICW